MLGRHLGWASDHVVEFDVVDANGKLLIVNSHGDHRDLFWAMRGSCSSAFGLIVTITFQLSTLSHPNMTTFTLPTVSFDRGGTSVALWWQDYAVRLAVSRLTCYIVLDHSAVGVLGVFAGSRAEALGLLLEDMVKGFHGLLTPEEIADAFVEQNYLGAVLWRVENSSIRSLEDLLSVKSLPTVDQRASRRKTKSFLVQRPLSSQGWETLFAHMQSSRINQVEIRPLGGLRHKITGNMYTTDESPLLRGHLFEFHYSNSWRPDPALTPAKIKEQDASLVANMNQLGLNFSNQFLQGSSLAYAAYNDWDLASPADSWFGADNALKLAELRRSYDPSGVLLTAAGRYMLSVPENIAG